MEALPHGRPPDTLVLAMLPLLVKTFADLVALVTLSAARRLSLFDAIWPDGPLAPYEAPATLITNSRSDAQERCPPVFFSIFDALFDNKGTTRGDGAADGIIIEDSIISDVCLPAAISCTQRPLDEAAVDVCNHLNEINSHVEPSCGALQPISMHAAGTVAAFAEIFTEEARHAATCRSGKGKAKPRPSTSQARLDNVPADT